MADAFFFFYVFASEQHGLDCSALQHCSGCDSLTVFTFPLCVLLFYTCNQMDRTLTKTELHVAFGDSIGLLLWFQEKLLQSLNRTRKTPAVSNMIWTILEARKCHTGGERMQKQMRYFDNPGKLEMGFICQRFICGINCERLKQEEPLLKLRVLNYAFFSFAD